MQISLGFKERI